MSLNKNDQGDFFQESQDMQKIVADGTLDNHET